MADTQHYNSKTLGMRVQKKLLGKMSSKSIVKAFIDDVSSKLLDDVYKLSKDYSNNNKKIAEKLMKNCIKIVVKVGILYHNHKFNDAEHELARQFRMKFRTICMTIVSFYEVDFSYDCKYLVSAVEECRTLLKDLVRHHLTSKSLGRVDNVFDFFTDVGLLNLLFRPDGQHRSHLATIVEDLNQLLASDNL